MYKLYHILFFLFADVFFLLIYMTVRNAFFVYILFGMLENEISNEIVKDKLQSKCS